MFHSLSLCSARLALSGHGARAGDHGSRSQTNRSGATLGVVAVALAAMVAVLPRPEFGARPLHLSGHEAAATLTAGEAASPIMLRDAAQDLRARLLDVPGVGAVSLHGLQVGGLEVNYTPARLARFGVSAAELRQAVPVQPGVSAPGHIALRLDAAQDGPQAIANLPVRAGHRVVRLGDIAAVARVPLDVPVATLLRRGRPMVEIVVTPAQGAAGAALDHRVASVLAHAMLPGNIIKE